mgnify:CR=1 FL=1
MDGKWCILAVFETIWNCREKCENRDGKWCILTVFEMTWNCRENCENRDGKWCILTVFEMIWNCRENCENRDGKRYILTVFETISFWNKDVLVYIITFFETMFETAIRKTAHVLSSSRYPGILKNKDSDRWILKPFEAIFWQYRKILKTRTLNCAFCCFLIRCFDLQRKCWKQ